MSEPPSSMGRSATLNLSIGPSCFVACAGCYNNFGKTSRSAGLVTRGDIRRLIEVAVNLGYRQATVAGGDPLTHPEIISILDDLREAGMFVKLDTVGSALLRPSREMFYGDPGRVHYIDPENVLSRIDSIGLPIDGSTPRIQARFRKAPEVLVDVQVYQDLFGEDVADERVERSSVVTDTVRLIDLAMHSDVEVCVNTVVHAGNLFDVPSIAGLLLDHQPDLWQLFEFQATGALASRNAERFSLAERSEPIDLISRAPVDHLVRMPSQSFSNAVDKARSLVADRFDVIGKSAAVREGGYLMVNDAGDLWIPGTREEPHPRVVANVRDSIGALRAVLGEFAKKVSAS